MHIQTVRSAAGAPQYVDDCWCWSVSAILAFDAIPGAITGDIGLCVGVGTRCVIRGASQFAGMEIGPTNTGVIGVIVRQNDAGATFTQNLAGVADMTQWHKYEIRLLGPTAQGEAQAKFLIDDQPQLALNYGAGTVLPDQKQGTGLGFTPGLINLAANAATTRMYIATDTVVVCCATEESALP
jgi:hypothetical protein